MSAGTAIYSAIYAYNGASLTTSASAIVDAGILPRRPAPCRFPFFKLLSRACPAFGICKVCSSLVGPCSSGGGLRAVSRSGRMPLLQCRQPHDQRLGQLLGLRLRV